MAEDSGDVLDSWEAQVDSGILDERLEKISISNTAAEESSSSQPVMLREDTGRTEYKPQVRILKREPNTNTHSATGNSPRVAKVNKPMKTLEQREAEYAEARMRIFGAAGAAGAENDSDATESNSVSSESGAETSSDRQCKVNKDDMKSANSVIRQPRGPDGSSGFHSNR